jgi:hypothetical protein
MLFEDLCTLDRVRIETELFVNKTFGRVYKSRVLIRQHKFIFGFLKVIHNYLHFVIFEKGTAFQNPAILLTHIFLWCTFVCFTQTNQILIVGVLTT